jgi:hypothetical protein
MKEYYFLASYLPQLEIGHVPKLGFAELRELISVNVLPEDQAKVVQLLRQVDLENLQALWINSPLDPRGNLNEEELKQALEQGAWSETEPFEEPLEEYLEKYPNTKERLENFSWLLSNFYKEKRETLPGFTGEYYNFQYEWQWVVAAFRAKKEGRDIAVELQYEESFDPLIAQILAQKDALAFEPPYEYKELKPLFETYAEEPMELHKALVSYQFDSMVTLLGGDLFTIERVLNYAARLLLVERWIALDAQKGMELLDVIERKKA